MHVPLSNATMPADVIRGMTVILFWMLGLAPKLLLADPDQDGTNYSHGTAGEEEVWPTRISPVT